MPRWILLVTLALSLSGNAVPGAEDAPAAPQFSSKASAVTVDVLVLDKDGVPVRGLSRDDFIVLEDGQAQTIVGFEARDMPAPEAGGETVEGSASPEVATNRPAPGRPGRVLVLLVDDLGITPQAVRQLVPPLSGWVQERADARDEITIMTTSGEVWWSDTVARGRDDLMVSLGRIKGRKLVEPQSMGALSAWEAYQIAVVHAASRLPEYSVSANPSGGGQDGAAVAGGVQVVGRAAQVVTPYPRFLEQSTLARVLQRWFDQRLCECPPEGPQPAGPSGEAPLKPCEVGVRRCMARIHAVADERQNRWARRARITLTALRNLSLSLAPVAGRKSVLLVSEEFLRDDSLGGAVQESIADLQRGNVAVYFVGARGLVGNPVFSVEQDRTPRAQDVLGLGREDTTLATAGAEALADATGGVAITSSNDLAAGLERMARDASAYYVLGFQPEEPPDGRWHDLDVRVARSDVSVRARRRYLAEPPEVSRRATRRAAHRAEDAKKDEGAGKRPLDTAILTGSARGHLPLRLGAYVGGTNDTGQARVTLVVEIANDHVRVDRSSAPWRAALDLTVMAAGLYRTPEVPIDERLQLSLDASGVAHGWWLVPREIWLPPGVAQVRVLVRDVLSGEQGIVTERLAVPDVTQPYLSTPILTDRTLPPPTPGSPARLVPTLQRRFGRKRQLFCQYEVFSFGGFPVKGLPQLLARYTLLGPGEQVISTSPPTPIETDGRHAVRRITLPSGELEDGAYVLAVEVEDRLARKELTARAPFVIQDSAPPVTP